jgi:hypothetical protein
MKMILHDNAKIYRPGQRELISLEPAALLRNKDRQFRGTH